MRTLLKTALIAGALALSSVAVSTPAAAQSFGFSYSTGPNYGYRYGNYDRGRYLPYRRDCRPVTRVRYDRFGYRHVVRTTICRPPYGYGYGYRYRPYPY